MIDFRDLRMSRDDLSERPLYDRLQVPIVNMSLQLVVATPKGAGKLHRKTVDCNDPCDAIIPSAFSAVYCPST